MNLQNDKKFFDALMLLLILDKPLDIATLKSALKAYWRWEKEKLDDWLKWFRMKNDREINLLWDNLWNN